jgi:hypothetical protein
LKDILELLRAKENQLKDLETQIESLRLAARILKEDESGRDSRADSVPQSVLLGAQAPSRSGSKAWP